VRGSGTGITFNAVAVAVAFADAIFLAAAL